MRQLLPVDAAPEGGEDPFAVYRIERTSRGSRPWVFANMVAGIDGSASVDGRVGGLSNARDRELFVLLRSLADVVIIGAATVRAEGYGPVRLPEALQQARVASGKPAIPPLAIVSRSLALDWTSALFAADAPTRCLVITAAAADDAALARAHECSDVIVAGDEAVDFSIALTELHERRCAAALTEGGPTLLGELMAVDLLDELCLTLAPMSGGDPLPVAIRPDGAGDLTPSRLASVLEEDGQLFLRYLLGPEA